MCDCSLDWLYFFQYLPSFLDSLGPLHIVIDVAYAGIAHWRPTQFRQSLIESLFTSNSWFSWELKQTITWLLVSMYSELQVSSCHCLSHVGMTGTHHHHGFLCGYQKYGVGVQMLVCHVLYQVSHPPKFHFTHFCHLIQDIHSLSYCLRGILQDSF